MEKAKPNDKHSQEADSTPEKSLSDKITDSVDHPKADFEPDEPETRPGAPIVPDPFFFPEPYSVWE